MKAVKTVQDALYSMNGLKHDLIPEDFLFPSKKQNALLIHETNGQADLMICVHADVLDRLNQRTFPDEFSLNDLPDLSILIEELSHFNTYVDRALKDQDLSALEMEVQAEVDKFGVLLDWIEKRNESHLKDEIYRILFEDLKLGSWVRDDEVERYEEAHRIAKNFCRKLLVQNPEAHERKEIFRDFFHASTPKKLGSVY